MASDGRGQLRSVCSRASRPAGSFGQHKYTSSGISFFFQAEDGIRDVAVTGVQTCALPICPSHERSWTPAYFLGRYHADHLAAGVAALAAIYPMAQNPWDFPELLKEGLLPHKIAEVYIMGAPVVNHFVDISDVIDIKIEALLCHASQFIGRTEQMETMIRTRSADLGAKYGVAYAEEFHRAENR